MAHLAVKLLRGLPVPSAVHPQAAWAISSIKAGKCILSRSDHKPRSLRGNDPRRKSSTPYHYPTGTGHIHSILCDIVAFTASTQSQRPKYTGIYLQSFPRPIFHHYLYPVSTGDDTGLAGYIAFQFAPWNIKVFFQSGKHPLVKLWPEP